MGADMILVTAPSPHYPPAVRKRIEQWCDANDLHPDLGTIAEAVGFERADRLVIQPWLRDHGEYEFELDTPEWEHTDELDAWIRERVKRATTTIVANYRRDLTVIGNGRGRDHYITGGMSWGDDPTDAYSEVNWLGQAELYEKPITWPEAHRALNTLKEKQ